MIRRNLEKQILEDFEIFPAVAILGPRQVGKTTLADEIAKHFDPNYKKLDLELPSHMKELTEGPELYFKHHEGHLIIIDEVQRFPELFQILRGVIDERRRLGFRTKQFLLLGSASKELLRQSESLAGRISYKELEVLNIQEVGVKHAMTLWVRGGFPDSFLAQSDAASMQWRKNFIRAYLHRDIPQMGANVSVKSLERFLTLLASRQGCLLNEAVFANDLHMKSSEIKDLIDLMEALLLVRVLRPWYSNVGKRLVKAPKVYIRDSGLTHALLSLTTLKEIKEHRISGVSWESFVIENILSVLDFTTTPWFYRAEDTKEEVDLVLECGLNKLIAIEIKSKRPDTIPESLDIACADLKVEKAYIVYPGTERYSLSSTVEAISLQDLMTELS